MTNNNPWLVHYGIKGQKWGIRRFQEEGGSLTDAGRNRYGVESRTFKLKFKESGDRKQKYQNSGKSQATPEEIQARKEKAKKIFKIAAGVSVAAIASYGIYKGGKAVKGWHANNMKTVAAIDRAKTNMLANKMNSMSAGGWSKVAEKNYQMNLRKQNRAQLLAYLGKRVIHSDYK